MNNTLRIPGVKKIAVLRANALGDFVFALPALQALKETYADAEITWLGCPWHKEYLENRPSPIDQVVVIPKSPGVRDEKPFDSSKVLDEFFKRMRKEKFDIVIQLHGGGHYTNPFVLQLGAGLTAGLKDIDAPPLDRWTPYIYYQNETLRYLEVIRLLGASTPDIQPHITVTRGDVIRAIKKLRNIHQPFVVIHPGATDIRRRWDPTRFAMVGDALADQGYRIIITGTDSEKKLADTIISRMRYPADNFCSQLSLGTLTGLLYLASILISNDTGPLHVAEAIETPSIGIYWCGNIINGGPMTRTLHRPQLSWIVECPLCHINCSKTTAFDRSKTKCQHETSFVNDVRADEVLDSAYDLLQKKYQINRMERMKKVLRLTQSRATKIFI